MDERSRMLVIDDDRTHLDMVEVMIGETYDVMPAASGEAALALLRGGEIPDLILLDIDMPGLDGYQTYRRLREIKALEDTPVIFLTGMTGSEAELRVLQLGAQDYCTKPVVSENLLARIRLRLEEARRYRRVQSRLHDAGIDEERFAALTRGLTPAEQDVARLIVLGLGNQEIARRLNYTPGYVKNLATVVYEKMGVHSRAELRGIFRT